MMHGQTLVERFLHAFESGDREALRDILSEDFVFLHKATPQRYDKTDYLLLADRLHAGIPDWRFEARLDPRAHDRIEAALQVTGTHTGRLDLSEMGLAPLRPTGRPITLPSTRGTWEVEDGAITRFEVAGRPGGGMPGVLAQLGVSVAETRSAV